MQHECHEFEEAPQKICGHEGPRGRPEGPQSKPRCSLCNGSGKVNDKTCPRCLGSGTQ